MTNGRTWKREIAHLYPLEANEISESGETEAVRNDMHHEEKVETSPKTKESEKTAAKN